MFVLISLIQAIIILKINLMTVKSYILYTSQGSFDNNLYAMI